MRKSCRFLVSTTLILSFLLQQGKSMRTKMGVWAANSESSANEGYTFLSFFTMGITKHPNTDLLWFKRWIFEKYTLTPLYHPALIKF